MSVVATNQNQLPHSRIAVCANFPSQVLYQIFPVLNYTYARSRNVRPCLPWACAEAARTTNHAAATRSSSARRVRTIPAGALALVRLGRYSWPSRRASPRSTQHRHLSQLCPPLPMWHASIRTFEERTHILATVCSCMRVSLLQLLLWLLVWGVLCLLVGALCVWAVCV